MITGTADLPSVPFYYCIVTTHFANLAFVWISFHNLIMLHIEPNRHTKSLRVTKFYCNESILKAILVFCRLFVLLLQIVLIMTDFAQR